MKREICAPEVPASQMVLTIITDEQLEAFADAVVKKYQQSVQPRSTAGKSGTTSSVPTAASARPGRWLLRR